MKLKTVTFFDVFLILVILSISFYFFKNQDGAQGDTVLIFINNKLHSKYELNKNQRINIPGQIGDAKLLIEDAKVQLIESPCPHQICVHTGKIRNTFNQIVCAPGHFMIKIDSDDNNNEVDAIVQ